LDNWISANTDNEIKTLMDYYGGFHDSCISEIKYASGAFVDSEQSMHMGNAEDRQVEIVFQRQWEPVAIILRFIGMRKMNITGWQRNYSPDIYGCYLSIHNNLIVGLDDNMIVWADDSSFNPKQQLERELLSEPSISYIIADKLFWKSI
jgi:hypothetical protein